MKITINFLKKVFNEKKIKLRLKIALIYLSHNNLMECKDLTVKSIFYSSYGVNGTTNSSSEGGCSSGFGLVPIERRSIS